MASAGRVTADPAGRRDVTVFPGETVEIRRRNLLRPDEFPYRSVTGMEYEIGSYVECLEKAAVAADYPKFREEQAALRELSTPIIEWFTDHFVPERARRADPDASPLNADLRGMPPALFTVGTLDPLLDDTLFMAQRWLAAGNRAELAVYPGGVHGFNLFPMPLGEAALRRSESFLASAFSGEPQ